MIGHNGHRQAHAIQALAIRNAGIAQGAAAGAAGLLDQLPDRALQRRAAASD